MGLKDQQTRVLSDNESGSDQAGGWLSLTAMLSASFILVIVLSICISVYISYRVRGFEVSLKVEKKTKSPPKKVRPTPPPSEGSRDMASVTKKKDCPEFSPVQLYIKK